MKEEDILRSEISALLHLKESEGWKILTRELESQAKVIREEIMKVGGESNIIKYSGHDINRFNVMYIEDLIEKPEELIKTYESQL